MSQSVRNILVVSVNWLGDAVFATPVFKNLKIAYPTARITCLCVPRVKDVLAHCPFIDDFIIYDERGVHRMPWGKWQIIKQIRSKRCDIAFFLHRSAGRAWMALLAGVPIRVGYCKSPSLLTHPIAYRSQDMHRSDMYLQVLKNYGLLVKDTRCELTVPLEQMRRADALLLNHGILDADDYIVLHIAGNWHLKRWPKERFMALGRAITERLRYKVVITAAAVDVPLATEVAQGIPGVVLLAGKTEMAQALAVFKRAAVVVSSDSGPLHLANSVGTSVVGLFGPTRSEVTGPRGMGKHLICFHDVGCNQAPCYHLNCPNNVCMQAIGVDDVIKAISKFTSP